MKQLLIVCSILFLSTLKASNVKLIGGEVADMADWPASVRMITSSSWCSATVVGERVVLTAAHCVSHKSRATFNGIGGTCYRHPEYSSGNQTADWVLCLLDKEFEADKYETINTDPALFKLGEKLKNTGFGCTKWGYASDKKFRTGLAKVVRLPSGTNYDIVTSDSVALCSGDSGGAAFFEVSGRRLVVGVNSRSNTTTTSYLSSVASMSFQKWAVSFMETHGVYICGLGNSRDVLCR